MPQLSEPLYFSTSVFNCWVGIKRDRLSDHENVLLKKEEERDLRISALLVAHMETMTLPLVSDRYLSIPPNKIPAKKFFNKDSIVWYFYVCLVCLCLSLYSSVPVSVPISLYPHLYPHLYLILCISISFPIFISSFLSLSSNFLSSYRCNSYFPPWPNL